MKKGKLLLACLLVVFAGSSSGFAQRLTNAIVKELRVRPASENNYIGTECLFELKIPYIRSEQVQASIPSLPSGVTFLSLRRSDYFDVTSGTKIEIWFSFSSAGKYRIPALNVFFNNRSNKISFEPFEIFEDPRNREPQVIVTFEDGKEFVYQKRNKNVQKYFMEAKTGKPLVFTVSLQYAIQLFSLDWILPKDAYIKQLEKIEFKTNGNNTNYSAEKIPIGVYEWEPLSSGKMTLPEFNIVATSFNGARISLALPYIEITVKDGSVAEKTENMDSYFSYAFINSFRSEKKAGSVLVTEDDCEKIAMLRMKERRSFPFENARAERMEFEKSLHVENEMNEASLPLMGVLLIMAVFFVLMIVLFVVLKKMIPLSVFSILFVVFVSLFIVIHVRAAKKYGVFKGGEIHSVPEVTAESIATIDSGSVVQIEQKASGWYFVRLGNTGGWVDVQSVSLIE